MTCFNPFSGLRWLLSAASLAISVATFSEAASAEIFVSNRGSNEILVFADDADGNTAPLRRVGGPLTQIGSGALNGVALDVQNGEIFASVRNNRILVFDVLADGNVAPLRTINGPATGIDFPAALAVDTLNNELYVVNSRGDGLLVFERNASGNCSPLRTIEGGATGINQPTGIFVNLDAGEVFVTNESSLPGVSVFPRLGDGNIPPLRAIMGPATTFSFAIGTFADPATGEQLVSDFSTDRVLIFPLGSDGNVAPTRVLSSSALASVGGITLTNENELLISDILLGGIVGFDASSSGPSAPTRELRGPLTGISSPIYVVSSNSPFPGAVFTDAPRASIATRAGGSNPQSYTAAQPPFLGQDLNLTVDLTLTGSSSALILFATAPANQVLLGGQVLLLDRSSSRTFGPFPGPIANATLPIPANLSLAGTTIYSQAIHFSSGPGTGAAFVLSNALDLTLGVQ